MICELQQDELMEQVAYNQKLKSYIDEIEQELRLQKQKNDELMEEFELLKEESGKALLKAEVECDVYKRQYNSLLKQLLARNEA